MQLPSAVGDVGMTWAPAGHSAGMEYSDIAQRARTSTDYRRVLWTGRYTQLVAMTLQPGEEIGEEVHDDHDQILAFVAGTGRAVVAGEDAEVGAGGVLVVPAGTKHNVTNPGQEPLVLWTVYGPPEHADGTVHPTKADADAAEHD